MNETENAAAVADVAAALRDAIVVYDRAIDALSRRLVRLQDLAADLGRSGRMDVQDALIKGIREGRLRIVSREDYVVNGRKMAKLEIEGVP